MRLLTNWQNFTVSIDDATFTVSPFTVGDRLSALRIMQETVQLGSTNIWKFSRETREDLVDLVCSRVIGWKGVTDAAGNELPFDPQALRRYMRADVLLHLFFLIEPASRLTEEERKNSFSASKSEKPAPDISIVQSVA